jgi:integrase
VKHLVNATQGRFRDLVCGALLTGCRYGEVIRTRVTDLNASAGTVIVRLSKAGKPRHVVLAAEGKALFDQSFGDCEARPTCDVPHLAHTYASSLAMKGVPMGVIARSSGTAIPG